MPKEDIIIYHFDSNNGAFISFSIADTDPLEGTPLIPAHATDVKPPVSATGNAAMFDVEAGTWSEVADFRGVVYDTATKEDSVHTQLGVLPTTITSLKPVGHVMWDGAAWVDDVTAMQKAKVESIVLEYRNMLDSGITYNGSTFQSDDKSITALSETLTAIQNGWGIPANFMWFDVDNIGHVADLTFLKGLAIALADHKSALFARLQTAKASISTATITELNTIKL